MAAAAASPTMHPLRRCSDDEYYGVFRTCLRVIEAEAMSEHSKGGMLQALRELYKVRARNAAPAAIAVVAHAWISLRRSSSCCTTAARRLWRTRSC